MCSDILNYVHYGREIFMVDEVCTTKASYNAKLCVQTYACSPSQVSPLSYTASIKI